MKNNTLLLAVAILIAACTTNNEKIHCHLEGTVADSTYTKMLLSPSCSDLRAISPDTIPVINGKFSFDIYTDQVMPYELIAMEEYNSGTWYTSEFFAEEGTVNITFYSRTEEKVPTMHSESPTNRRFLQLNAQLDSIIAPLAQEEDSLIKIGRWETPRMMELNTLFEAAKDEQTKKELRRQANALYESGEAYTPEYHVLQAKSDKAYEEMEKFTIDFIRNDRTIVGLHMLQRQTMQRSPDESLCTALFNEIYKPLFKDHPLGEYMDIWVQSRGVKVGGHYIDFTAPDLDGNRHTLSKEIDGKVALIDLWASWCGPCRRTSKSMIPVYEKYKERGFTIVGVAREEKRENMASALANDGYPWLNLLELNDENKIWSKYGVNYSGGITILVDRDGTILAIRPTAEEVEKILRERL